MKSMIRKVIPVAAGLLLFAVSPAFAARHDLNGEARRDYLSASRSDNASPYIGQWVEGYPRSTAPAWGNAAQAGYPAQHPAAFGGRRQAGRH
jgi:hypothetical protein